MKELIHHFTVRVCTCIGAKGICRKVLNPRQFDSQSSEATTSELIFPVDTVTGSE